MIDKPFDPSRAKITTNDPTVETSERLETTAFGIGDLRFGEESRGNVGEVDPGVDEVRLSFRFVPDDLHTFL